MKHKVFMLLFLAFLITTLIIPVFCQDNALNASENNPYANKSNNSLWDSDFITFLFGLSGFIGTLFTIIGFYLVIKERKINKVMHEFLEQKMETENIKVELESMKKVRENYATENKKYKEDNDSLRVQVDKVIPQEAKKAVLKGKLHSYEEQLIQTYDSILAIRNDLKEVGDFQILPELKKMIDNEIRPDYALNQERSRIKGHLLVLTTGATITSSVISYPFDRILTLFLLTLAIGPFIKLMKLQSSGYPLIDKKNVVKYLYKLFFTLSILCLMISFIVSSDGPFVRMDYMTYYEREFISMNLFLAFFLLALCGTVLFIIYRRTNKQ